MNADLRIRIEKFLLDSTHYEKEYFSREYLKKYLDFIMPLAENFHFIYGVRAPRILLTHLFKSRYSGEIKDGIGYGATISGKQVIITPVRGNDYIWHNGEISPDLECSADDVWIVIGTDTTVEQSCFFSDENFTGLKFLKLN